MSGETVNDTTDGCTEEDNRSLGPLEPELMFNTTGFQDLGVAGDCIRCLVDMVGREKRMTPPRTKAAFDALKSLSTAQLCEVVNALGCKVEYTRDGEVVKDTIPFFNGDKIATLRIATAILPYLKRGYHKKQERVRCNARADAIEARMVNTPENTRASAASDARLIRFQNEMVRVLGNVQYTIDTESRSSPRAYPAHGGSATTRPTARVVVAPRASGAIKPRKSAPHVSYNNYGNYGDEDFGKCGGDGDHSNVDGGTSNCSKCDGV